MDKDIASNNEESSGGENVKKNESNESELLPVVPAITNIDNEPVITRLSFNDYDSVQDAITGSVSEINAPKTIDRLEEISTSRAIQRKLEEEDEDINDKIRIHTDSIKLDDLEIFDFDKKDKNNNDNVEILLDDIEELV